MATFSKDRFNRCLRAWLSKASTKIEDEAKLVFKELGEAVVNASAGNEDKLALSCVKTAVAAVMIRKMLKLEE